jgi:hypothetical protein
MIMHIQKFVDRIRGQEARGMRDFTMTMNEAKDLHADITRLLLQLHTLQTEATKTPKTDAVQVQIGGGYY